jgi:hypothetical protein
MPAYSFEKNLSEEHQLGQRSLCLGEIASSSFHRQCLRNRVGRHFLMNPSESEVQLRSYFRRRKRPVSLQPEGPAIEISSITMPVLEMMILRRYSFRRRMKNYESGPLCRCFDGPFHRSRHRLSLILLLLF